MRKGIDCFVSYIGDEATRRTIEQLRDEPLVNGVFVVTSGDEVCGIGDCEQLHVEGKLGTEAFEAMCGKVESEYALLCDARSSVALGYKALRRMYDCARAANASILYSDRNVAANGKVEKHPVIDVSEGSVRDDFDFGSVILVAADVMEEYVSRTDRLSYASSCRYDFTLHCMASMTERQLFHLREYLYTEEELDLRKSGEKQFDYVNPRNRDVQIERERAFTEYLKRIGAYVSANEICAVDVEEGDFECEASVIIPVRNRVRTIADAIKSVLSQKADFKFNVIVVDNLSTDGTSEAIAELAAADNRVVHIVPSRTDLGIGGCWSLAFNDERCGRFSVQLDSDDLYSSDDTLSRIVAKFREERCGMVIGSYRMCNFMLETLPPGLIDHREWTDTNGFNNALRINGLGAPRAFYTPLLRKIGMPNTSYGEDYAVGLAFSRRYRIGRIYEELYLCRRWEGNSDAALSIEQVNANNAYKDSIRAMEIRKRRRPAVAMFDEQIDNWTVVRERYEQLAAVEVKEVNHKLFRFAVQYNPARMVSTGAKIDKQTISERPCFLCKKNRPVEQFTKDVLGKYDLLVNPFPILPKHFTIACKEHLPQSIKGHYGDMLSLVDELGDLLVFYNGPKCGASAPDHLHFQAGSRGVVPVERDWADIARNSLAKIDNGLDASSELFMIGDPYTAFVIAADSKEDSEKWFERLYSCFEGVADYAGEDEPMMNIIAWRQQSENKYITIVFPRGKHRPDCYYAEGEDKLMVSPGSLDMGGLFIVPRAEDFAKLDAEQVASIMRECSLNNSIMDSIVETLSL